MSNTEIPSGFDLKKNPPIKILVEHWITPHDKMLALVHRQDVPGMAVIPSEPTPVGVWFGLDAATVGITFGVTPSIGSERLWLPEQAQELYRIIDTNKSNLGFRTKQMFLDLCIPPRRIRVKVLELK